MVLQLINLDPYAKTAMAHVRGERNTWSTVSIGLFGFIIIIFIGFAIGAHLTLKRIGELEEKQKKQSTDFEKCCSIKNSWQKI